LEAPKLFTVYVSLSCSHVIYNQMATLAFQQYHVDCIKIAVVIPEKRTRYYCSSVWQREACIWGSGRRWVWTYGRQAVSHRTMLNL